MIDIDVRNGTMTIVDGKEVEIYEYDKPSYSFSLPITVAAINLNTNGSKSGTFYKPFHSDMIFYRVRKVKQDGLELTIENT